MKYIMILSLLFAGTSLQAQDFIGYKLDAYHLQGAPPDFRNLFLEKWKYITPFSDRYKEVTRIDISLTSPEGAANKIHLQGREKWKTKELLPDGPMYHENGALFANTGKHTRGYIHDSIPFYHSNGQLLMRTYIHELSKDIKVTEEFDANGVMINNWYIENKYPEPVWIKKNGREYQVDNYMNRKTIAPSANFPITKVLRTSYKGIFDSYHGTLTCGVYSIGDRYELTGVFSTSMVVNGNGTVVFLEDTVEKKYYWAVIVDSIIIKAFPALKTEKPLIDDLYAIEKRFYNIIREKKSISGYPISKNHILMDSDNKDRYYTVGEVNTPNINNHNGYGVKSTFVDDLIPAQSRKIEVGIYKNGKLNGPGYQCIYDRRITEEYKSNDIWIRNTDVTLKYGIFKEGVFQEGFENIGNLDNYSSYDFWKFNGYDNVQYAYKGDYYTKQFRTLNNDPLPFKSLAKGDEIYIKSINRLFKITGLDYVKKEITLESDVEGKSFYINELTTIINGKSDEQFLVVKKEKIDGTVDCATMVDVPIIETVEKKVTSTQRSYIGSTSYVKDGVKYTYPKQPDVVRTSRSYEDQVVGYRKDTCPRCNGTGKVSAKKDVKIGYRFQL